MWINASCSSVGDNVANRTLECFLQGRSHLTVQVGVATAMERSKEVISIAYGLGMHDGNPVTSQGIGHTLNQLNLVNNLNKY